jgi:hypothetical protein
LLSLLFNIAHASVIAMEDDCHHNTVTEYLMEQNIHDECNDICDMDHLFHFIAILSVVNTDFNISAYSTRPIQKITIYYPPFKENSTKPPIV